MTRTVLLPVLAAALLAACSASPAAPSAAPTASAVPSPSVPPSVAPPPSPTTRPAPSVSVAPSPAPIAAAPAGTWTGVHWIEAGKLPLGSRAEVSVNGWSGGYVVFEQTPGYDASGTEAPVVIRASSSSDGVHWTAPTTLETGFSGGFRIERMVEGPNGLLALGYPYGDTCGGPEPLAFLWASSDGRTWERLPMPHAFTGNSIETISGGEAGYIAFGTKADSEIRGIWTSTDGRSWTSRPLPTVSNGTVAIDAAVTFSDGFALIGTVLGEEGCGGASHIKPAVWVSADGAAWTRASLPGASTAPNALLRIHRIGDHLLVTQTFGADGSRIQGWTSADGRAWTASGEISNDLYWIGVSDRLHTVAMIGPDSGVGAMTILSTGADGVVRNLEQSEIGPVATEDRSSFSYTPGPTGILVVVPDGSVSWLGLPS